MYSAAFKLDAGMVDWVRALRDARLLHISGITFGLAGHSNYERNYNYEAFKEAIHHKPSDCLVGLDFNYRATLWSPEAAKTVMRHSHHRHGASNEMPASFGETNQVIVGARRIRPTPAPPLGALVGVAPPSGVEIRRVCR